MTQGAVSHSVKALETELGLQLFKRERNGLVITDAGRHFNRGQRAFFFALGYLGWFVSPWVLFVSTALVVVVIWRRQFASNAWRAMGS